MSLTHSHQVKQLYKTILKLHKGLPNDLKILGNNYARDEFKRHKKCNSNEAKIFMNEWLKYAIQLSEQLGLRGPHMAKKFGSGLNISDLDHFRDEQLQQLYELKIAAETKEDKPD